MKTRRFCPKCGRPLLKSTLRKTPNKYAFQCYGCDEDFCRIEVLRIKDMSQVKILQQRTLSEELQNNNHLYSILKPYPRY